MEMMQQEDIYHMLWYSRGLPSQADQYSGFRSSHLNFLTPDT